MHVGLKCQQKVHFVSYFRIPDHSQSYVCDIRESICNCQVHLGNVDFLVVSIDGHVEGYSITIRFSRRWY